jgi:hypothetical protein
VEWSDIYGRQESKEGPEEKEGSGEGDSANNNIHHSNLREETQAIRKDA